jgi:hypothetical protein
MMKVYISTTDRETLWYEYCIWKLYGFECIATIHGLLHDFGTNTAQNQINDDKTSSNTL